MKTRTAILVSMMAILVTSCKSNYYYQVYKATATEKIELKDNRMVYEDANCIISYNLWDQGGNIGFSFYNKTDQNIYLNLEESFFILNGVANNYYKNRVFTDSKSGIVSRAISGYSLFPMSSIAISNTTSNITSSGFSTSYTEEKIICIPFKSSKVVAEYKINESLFRDCDLMKYPSKRQVKTKSFTQSNSPIVFSNRLTYQVGKNDNWVKVANDFYVSEITNLPQSEMFSNQYEQNCGKKSRYSVQVPKDNSPNRFYIKYGVDLNDSNF